MLHFPTLRVEIGTKLRYVLQSYKAANPACHGLLKKTLKYYKEKHLVQGIIAGA